MFGGALRLQKGFGGVWGALEIGSGWEGHWVSIGGPEEVYRAWGGTTLRVLGDACGSCWGSRKESGGTLGLWGVFNGPGVCGMFWEAQERVGGFVGTRESIVAPGGIIGRIGQGNPQTWGGGGSPGFFTFTANVAPGGSGVPLPPRLLWGVMGGVRNSPQNPSGPAASHWPPRPPVLALSQSAPENAALGAVPWFRASLLPSWTTSPEILRGPVERL